MNRTLISRRGLLKATGGGLAMATLAAPGLLRAQTPSVFKIGALNPLTGNSQVYGPGMQATITAVAEAVNAAGGAGGMELEVITGDDQTLPEPAVLAARKLVAVDGCRAIVGTLTSPVTLAVMNAVTLPNKIIHMHLSGAEELLTGYGEHCFKFGQAAGSYGRVYAADCEAQGYANPVVLQLNNSSATSLADSFIQRWQSYGHDAPPRIIYDAARPSYRSELQQALSYNPDIIILAAYLEDAAILFREWYQTGIPAKFLVAPYSMDSRLIETLGNEVVEGVYQGSPVHPVGNPAYALFDAAYQEKMGQPGSSNRFTPDCWDMTTVLALGIEAAAVGADNIAIAQAMYGVANAPGVVVNSYAEGKEALAAGETDIKYAGAGSNLNLNDQGVDTASILLINRIENGELVMMREVSDA